MSVPMFVNALARLNTSVSVNKVLAGYNHSTSKASFSRVFQCEAKVDLNQVHHKQTQGQIYVPLLTAFRCVQKQKIYPDIDLDEQS